MRRATAEAGSRYGTCVTGRWIGRRIHSHRHAPPPRGDGRASKGDWRQPFRRRPLDTAPIRLRLQA